MSKVASHPEKYPTRVGIITTCIGCKNCASAYNTLVSKKMLDLEKLSVKPTEKELDMNIPTRVGTMKLGDYTPLTKETVSRWKTFPSSKGKEPATEEEEVIETEEEEKPVLPWSTTRQEPSLPWMTSSLSSETKTSPLAQTWSSQSSYDGKSSIPTLRRSSSNKEKVLRRVVDTATGRKYFIGEQEVPREVFMAEI